MEDKIELTSTQVFEKEKEARDKKKKIDQLLHQDDPEFWEQLNNEYTNWEEKQLPEEPINKVYTAEDLLQTQFPPQNWLVEGLIPAEGFTALTGQPGSYKSFLTEVLAVSLTTDKPFLGHFQVSHCPVLIIDKENSAYLLKERFSKLKGEEPFLDPIYLLEDPDKFKLTNSNQMKDLIKFIKDKQIKLVIIDSFVHLNQGDENDSSAVVKTFEALKKLNCAILFIHHHRKAIKFFTGTLLESIRGSSDIGAELESHLALDIVPNGLRLSQSKNRRGQLAKPFLITPLVTQDHIEFVFNGEILDEESKLEETRQFIIEILTLKKELSRKELIEILSEKSSRISVDRTIKNMEQNNELKSRFLGKFKYLALSETLLNNVTQLSSDELSPLEQSYLEDID